MGKIMAVNISEKKGTQKKNVHSARLMEEFGIEKDAHAGKWHRQVSLLSYEKIEEFKWIRSEGIAGWHQTSQRRGIIRSDTDREKMS